MGSYGITEKINLTLWYLIENTSKRWHTSSYGRGSDLTLGGKYRLSKKNLRQLIQNFCCTLIFDSFNYILPTFFRYPSPCEPKPWRSESIQFIRLRRHGIPEFRARMFFDRTNFRSSLLLYRWSNCSLRMKCYAQPVSIFRKHRPIRKQLAKAKLLTTSRIFGRWRYQKTRHAVCFESNEFAKIGITGAYYFLIRRVWCTRYCLLHCGRSQCWSVNNVFQQASFTLSTSKKKLKELMPWTLYQL